MSCNRIAAVAIITLSCALSLASCVQSQESLETGSSAADLGEVGESRQSVDASTFRFATVLPDDGQDDAGGWQEAHAQVKFGDWRHPFSPRFWSCTMRVGMPIRTKARGTISAAAAARMTAEIETDASVEVMHSRSEWPVAAGFCIALNRRMVEMFRSRYAIGARVSGQ